jgi:hypothetical protein
MPTKTTIRALLLTGLTLLLVLTGLSTATSASARSVVLYDHTVHSGSYWGPSYPKHTKDVTRTYTGTSTYVRGPLNFHIVNRAGTTNLGVYRVTCTVTVAIVDLAGNVYYSHSVSLNTPKAQDWPTANQHIHYSVKRTRNVYRVWPNRTGWLHFRTTVKAHMYPEHVPGSPPGGSWLTPPNLYIIAGQHANNDCIGYAHVTWSP